MKKVLIITYYWPPSGGAGVQRWLKFTKYLRDYGWEPIIYTPENPESPNNDSSLEKDLPKNLTVIKTKIWEPYNFYKVFIGQKKDQKINAAFLTESKKPKKFEKIAVWIRGNFFIPDARKFWVNPSIKYLQNYIKSNPVDAVISTGPPHSMHLIALGLKRKLNIPWMADFRDPWTNIDFYSKLMLSSFANRKHKRLELEVLKEADVVTCVGKTWLDELEELYKKGTSPLSTGREGSGVSNKFKFISNGYDPDDYSDEKVEADKKFSIVYIGTLDKSRNPGILWKTLSEIVKKNPEFAKDLQLKLVGKTDIAVTEDIENNGLLPYMEKIAYLTHAEVTQVQKKSQVLLLLINNTPNAMGITTGKLFEYFAAKRPILCIGPKGGDADKILEETKGGLISGYEDSQTLEANILYFYNKYKQGYLPCESVNIEKYSRKMLTGEVAEVLNEITAK
ncbi:MAG TPA: glycosyltransferase family 4 protein [Bacteroidia bacterium]|nr:glycosyltransferase family 4 protein [Bacteroidia bacterium]